jgi:hypothetical protein
MPARAADPAHSNTPLPMCAYVCVHTHMTHIHTHSLTHSLTHTRTHGAPQIKVHHSLKSVVAAFSAKFKELTGHSYAAAVADPAACHHRPGTEIKNGGVLLSHTHTPLWSAHARVLLLFFADVACVRPVLLAIAEDRQMRRTDHWRERVRGICRISLRTHCIRSHWGLLDRQQPHRPHTTVHIREDAWRGWGRGWR